jgi:ABC-type transport system involved in cytochrome bd biosynthesis fused ATPase/permease subunit
VERFAQYLDDIDDLFGMLGLVGERLRNLCTKLLTVLLILIVAMIAVQLTFIHPPTALAISTLLFVTLLYRAVTQKSYDGPHSA